MQIESGPPPHQGKRGRPVGSGEYEPLILAARSDPGVWKNGKGDVDPATVAGKVKINQYGSTRTHPEETWEAAVADGRLYVRLTTEGE